MGRGSDPRIQTPDDALVRPLVVTTCDVDHAIVHGRVPFAGPFPLGHEFVAEVVETGHAVSRFRRGDRVVVPFQIGCGRCDRCTRGLTGSYRTAGPGAATVTYHSENPSAWAPRRAGQSPWCGLEW